MVHPSVPAIMMTPVCPQYVVVYPFSLLVILPVSGGSENRIQR
jgi:NAD kinase